jgi:glutamate dehydrogenase
MPDFDEDLFFQRLATLAEDSPASHKAEELVPFGKKVIEYLPREELADEPVNDVAGRVNSLWEFMQHLEPQRPKIRVFNPILEEDGWVSDYTNIFIVRRNMPFLVDSVRIELNRRGLNIHTLKSTILTVSRDSNCRLQSAFADAEAGDSHREAAILIQVDLHSSREEHEELAAEIAEVLADVEVVTDDHGPMMAATEEIIEHLRPDPSGLDGEDLEEVLAFLQWLVDGYFTFLGYAEYQLEEDDTGHLLVSRPDRRLGVFRRHPDSPDAPGEERPGSGREAFYGSAAPLAFTKSAERSRVHRDAYSDYIIIKRYTDDGAIVGEYRILGLYTSPVYTRSPSAIPLIRLKVRQVIERFGLPPGSHDDKSLRQLIEVHPRDELFHSSGDELYRTLMGIWQINERRMVRLFMRVDPFEKFVSCIVYFPRDIYRTQVRQQVEDLLKQALDSRECDFTTYFSESVLARTQYVLRIDSDRYRDVDRDELEQRIISLTRDWGEELMKASIEAWGEELGRRRANRYRHAFPASYRDHFEPREAIHDIALFEPLSGEDEIAMAFYQPVGAEHNIMRFKLFHLNRQLELSELVPMLENLGFRVLGEHPYHLDPEQGEDVWLHDFTLKFGLDVAVDVSAVRGQFETAFSAIWHGDTENDLFNRLVIGARLEWRSVALLRLYARYLKQLAAATSHEFIAETLANNLEITRNLIALFHSTFDPRLSGHDTEGGRAERLSRKIREGLDAVANLNEDQVLRGYLQLIEATVRTNYFQQRPEGGHKPYISIKLMPQQVDMAPPPRPLYEIFVYSPRLEGVHLRAGKVARGGIRWSDRPEDYRTEVLGLVKAQQVKNAVIVPTGAKGGFVAKKADRRAGREAFQEEGIAAYRLFMRGMLDVTDNLVGGEVVPPPDVVRRDEDDTYLVVAADKGTATFSDIANEISAQYNHWLGDAFASGGSHGYDHKKMGITARGAWVAVQRHFRELGLNTQEDQFTAIGIGDMGGDVFGNGMLQSDRVRLLAAFNHQHIFIDPDPDPGAAFAERRRLFDLPRSSWEDYDPERISEGGGVFSRSAKSIELSRQIREAFEIEESRLEPDQLINRLLRAPVDLIWNGGIGTYVKASNESHQAVGDKINDSLRVDGRDLRCRVFGEGGNLGMTQPGRIEYSLAGGLCNTDFIDNAGGVDCSDHEVNIKILLNGLVADEDLTNKQRNEFLEKMTDEVADLVLQDIYRQTQSISIARRRCRQNFMEYWQCISAWEGAGRLDRRLESLPDDEEMAEREKREQCLTRPELAVLVSYAKILLKESIAASDLPDLAYSARMLTGAFPEPLVTRFGSALGRHGLRREIIVNQLANEVVDLMGLTFCQYHATATGAPLSEVVRAFCVARDIFSLERRWHEVENLDYRISADRQYQLFQRLMRVTRRACRWLLRNRPPGGDPGRESGLYAEHIGEFHELMPQLLDEELQCRVKEESSELMELGLSEETAALLAYPDNFFLGFGASEIARHTGKGMALVARLYHRVGVELELDWFARQLVDLETVTKWQDFARESLIDDLEQQRRALTRHLLESVESADDIAPVFSRWQEDQAGLLERWLQVVKELRQAPAMDFAICSYALKEFTQLVAATGRVNDGDERADAGPDDRR